jgi:hypothetical protein
MKAGTDDRECAGLSGEQKKIAARKNGISWGMGQATLRNGKMTC